jgi:tetratricopeptide (TPR) repeat protein
MPVSRPGGLPDNGSRGGRSEVELPDHARLTPHAPAYWRSVAGLGAQVAGALDYAHRQGVLHRDIKPANLLLDNQGTAWITDFGLAKLAEQDDLTGSGGVVGTLRYMAPEQWEGEPDSRSDIYMLGLTLYELLTFRPAFDATSRHRLIRQATQEEPPRPRAVNPKIPRDLETIVLKAIARDPGHRYPTAGAMADDLRRFFDDRPIRARRTSAIEHAWRWCRRDPALAAVSATALVLLLALAVGASIGYVRRTGALRVQSQLRSRAESESQRAEANLELAAKAFEEVFAKIGNVPLPQVLNETDETVWYTTASSAVVNQKDAAVLESLLKFYDQFAERNRENARWLHDTARAYRRVGEIQQLLGRADEAEEAYQRALDSYERLRQTSPQDPDYLIGLAGVHNALGEAVAGMGRFAEAVEAHRQALALLTARPQIGLTGTSGRFELARTYDALGFAAMIRRFGPPRPEAEAEHAEHDVDPADCCRRALQILEELAAADPANADYRFAMAKCYQHLSRATRPRGRGPRRRPPQQRVAYSEEAIRILDELIADFPQSPRYVCELAHVFASPGRFRAERDQADQSTDRLEQGVEMMERLVASYPDVPEYKATLAMCHGALADGLAQMGELDDAVVRYRQGVDLGRSLAEEYPDQRRYRFTLARDLFSLAVAYRSQSQWEKARLPLEELIERAAHVVEDSGGNTPGAPPAAQLLANAYAQLAQVLRELNQPELAEEASRKAREFEPLPRRPGWLPFGPRGARGRAEPLPMSTAEAQ